MTRGKLEDDRDARKYSSYFVTINERIEIPNNFTKQTCNPERDKEVLFKQVFASRAIYFR
jgi:hypothetical protein